MKLRNSLSGLVAVFVCLMGLAGAYAQQPPNQSKTPAIETTSLGEEAELPFTASQAKLDQKTQLASVKNRVIAEKGKAWGRELRPVSMTTSNSAEPQKPAGPADASELAKKLSNPVSSLISFPIQTNFDMRMGDGSGWRMTINVQPVIPVALNPKWNLISRTIIPIIHQADVTALGASQTGLGDVVQSFFLSPNKTEPFIWGIGPAILIPTATNEFLGSKQLGLGPTVVVLKQQHGWTVGMLWNHLWRVAGGSGRPRVNADFVQPFLSYSTKDGWSYTINTESTYDWTGNDWAVPIHFTVQKIVRFGKQPIQFGGAMRCWATSPDGGPEGCGLRIIVTGIFPKK